MDNLHSYQWDLNTLTLANRMAEMLFWRIPVGNLAPMPLFFSKHYTNCESRGTGDQA
jgi:hypothetical protein